MCKVWFRGSQRGSKGTGLKGSNSSQALRNPTRSGTQEVVGAISKRKFSTSVASEAREQWAEACTGGMKPEGTVQPAESRGLPSRRMRTTRSWEQILGQRVRR